MTSEIRKCNICSYQGPEQGLNQESKLVPCNVRKFKHFKFLVWRCPSCQSLHAPEIVDLKMFYEGYPIRNQKLDYFLKIWFGNIFTKLKRLGLTAQNSLIDYGCNSGLWLAFLQSKGMTSLEGYDPYVEKFSSGAVLNRQYDWVFSADVIEHDSSPKDFLIKLKGLMKPEGKLAILTPNASGIDLNQMDHFLHALHVPYHRHILSRSGLTSLAKEIGLKEICYEGRWYMDSWWPATSRRFIERLLLKGGNDLDAGYEPVRLNLFFKHPSLLFDLFFGYFLGSKKQDHMIVVFSLDQSSSNHSD